MRFGKRLVACAMLVIAFAGTLPAKETAKEATSPDERAELEMRIQSYVDACNAKDVEALIAHGSRLSEECYNSLVQFVAAFSFARLRR